MSNLSIAHDKVLKLKELAEQIIENNLGEKRQVVEIRNNNWVFMTDDDKAPYMVKFVPEKERTRLETEIALNGFLSSKTSIPMPTVIEHGEKDGEYFLMRSIIRGQPLSEEMGTCHNLKGLFHQSGEIIAQVHRIEFDTKGIINSEVKVDNHNIFSQEEFKNFLDKLLNKEVITREVHEDLNKIDISYYYDKRPYVLCHCDFAPANIIVNNGKVAGLIDFEWASACPFMDDLAGFDLFVDLEGYSKYIGHFYEGYAGARDIPNYYFENIDFYRFYRLVTTLSYQVNATDEIVDIETNQRMKEELSRYLRKSETFKRN